MRLKVKGHNAAYRRKFLKILDLTLDLVLKMSFFFCKVSSFVIILPLHGFSETCLPTVYFVLLTCMARSLVTAADGDEVIACPQSVPPRSEE